MKETFDFINRSIDAVAELETEKYVASEEEAHGFKQGLGLAKIIIEQTEELIKDNFPLETVEDVVKNLVDVLEYAEVRELIDSLYEEEDVEDYNLSLVIDELEED